MLLLLTDDDGYWVNKEVKLHKPLGIIIANKGWKIECKSQT